jgi:hypothetical protein
VPNLSSALGADIVFPAHSPFASVLTNPISIRAPTLPLCLSQWSRSQADRLFAAHWNGSRRDDLSGGFVAYPGTERHEVLMRLKAEMPEADLRVMPVDRRSEYFALTPEQRFEWWARSKVSIVLSLNRDLSMRVFDSLVAGQTIIVPRDLPDLDAVVPPAYQAKLGIVRFASFDIQSIRAAYREALAIFDRGGGKASACAIASCASPT